MSLGTARATVRLDGSSIAADAASIGSSIRSALSGIQGGIQSFGQTLQNAGQQLLPFSLAIAGVGSQGLNAASDFQQLITQIGVFGGVSGDALESVRELALQLGAETSFAASDAAAAMLEMLKSGMSLEQTMAAIRPTLDLAAAGGLNLASASNIVTSTLAQFGLGADQASRIANVLAQGANASAADVGELGDALATGGLIADQYGISLEDTVAILGVFANRNIRGAEAGTQLKSVLLNMARSTDDVQAAWDELGVSMYDAMGAPRDFNTVLLDLDAALDRLPIEDQNRLMTQLGGSYGIVGLNALRSANGIDDMRQAMSGAASAADVGAALMSGFSGQVESLKGSLETLLIEALTPTMQDGLTPMVTGIIEVVNSVTEWVKANPALVSAIVKAAGALAILGPALTAVGFTISFLASPVGILAGALAGLYIAFDQNLGGIRDIVGPVLADIGGHIEQIVGSLTLWQRNMEDGGLPNALGSLLANIMQVFNLMPGPDQEGDTFNFASGLVASIQEKLGELATAAQPALAEFQGLIGDWLGTVQQMWEGSQPAFQALADWFTGTALPGVFNYIRDVALPGLAEFIGALRNIWAIVGPTLVQLQAWFLYDALPAVINFVTTQVIPRVNEFIATLGGIWARVQPALASLFAWFVSDALPAVRDFIVNQAIPRINEFATTIGGIWNTVSTSLASLYNWFVNDALPAIRAFIDEQVTPTIEYWRDVIEGIWIVVQPALNSLHDWFNQSGLPTIMTKIGEAQTTWGNLRDALANLWTAVSPHLQNIYNWFQNTFQRIVEFISPVTNAISNIVAQAQRTLDMLARIGGWTPPPQPVTPTATFNPTVNGQLPTSYHNPYDNSYRPVSGMRDQGGTGLPGHAYLIGRGAQPEAFIPTTTGTFVPNIDQLMGGGGPDMVIQNLVIHASGDAEGRAAADAFEARLRDLRRSRG